MKSSWTCVLKFDKNRSISTGSERKLCEAICRGADLRINTKFRHNEHIDVTSDNPELIDESMLFRVTYLIDNRWSAGIITLRQPVSLPDGFGRPSMSFFMYNQDCSQAIARPYLDFGPITGTPGFSPLDDYSYMPKYHQQDNWDAGTNAPSSNFVYDFEEYHWLVRDSWREVFSHSADGTVVSGSLAALTEMFNSGCEIKVGIKGLCSDLTDNPADAIEHEVFVDIGSCYYYTKRKLFIAASHPLVRVKPEIPVRYASKNWDFGWLMLRTDGFIARRLCNPYTMKFSDSESRHAIRWFVR